MRDDAPAPLASDSAYAALAALPHDSLDSCQLAWLAAQRDWRVQRDEEATRPSNAITEYTHRHRARSGDRRFAALAAKPYAALGDVELAWLVGENTAQRDANEGHHTGAAARPVLTLAGVVVIAGVVASLIVLASGHYAKPQL